MRATLLVAALLAVTSSSLAQYRGGAQNPRDAAIVSEARYQSGDGTFGAAYVQEDGVEFKEESDGEGNRRGQYSYVGPDGQRRTVQYTAGKHGFVATGDHIPQAPPQVAPTPGYTPLPQYNSPDNNQYNPPPQQYNPPPQQQYRPTPAPYRPPVNQYNPPPQQYNPPPQQYNPPPQQYNPPPQQYNPPPQQYNPPPQQYTTPSPHRFFPPGKLNLNRTPDGYSYTFNKS